MNFAPKIKGSKVFKTFLLYYILDMNAMAALLFFKYASHKGTFDYSSLGLLGLFYACYCVAHYIDIYI